MVSTDTNLTLTPIDGVTSHRETGVVTVRTFPLPSDVRPVDTSLREQLNDARETVDGWPAWKQRALGGGKPSVRRAANHISTIPVFRTSTISRGYEPDPCGETHDFYCPERGEDRTT